MDWNTLDPLFAAQHTAAAKLQLSVTALNDADRARNDAAESVNAARNELDEAKRAVADAISQAGE